MKDQGAPPTPLMYVIKYAPEQNLSRTWPLYWKGGLNDKWTEKIQEARCYAQWRSAESAVSKILAFHQDLLKPLITIEEMEDTQ